MSFIKVTSTLQYRENSPVDGSPIGELIAISGISRRVLSARAENGSVTIRGRFDFSSETALYQSDLERVEFWQRGTGARFILDNLSGITVAEFTRTDSLPRLAGYKGFNVGLSFSASPFNDVLVGTRARDILRGRNGNDILRGGRGNDTLDGGNGNDFLAGHVGNDQLIGGAGDDRLNGQGGNDRMFGGFGDDRYWVNSVRDRVFEGVGNGEDQVINSVTFRAPIGIENVTLTGSQAIRALGNANDNILIGNNGRNTLVGYNGDDVLNGGRGLDRAFGGDGDDVYIVNMSSDIVGEGVGLGIDTIWSPVSFALRANVEHLQLMGSANRNGSGNELDNVLVGNRGNNTLNGLDGNDTLLGGPGSDTLNGGSGADNFVFDTAPGVADFIGDFVAGLDQIGLDTTVFTQLTPGASVASNFRSVGNAADGDDYLVYDQADGVLYYDAAGDGIGPLAAIADVGDGTALTAADVFAAEDILAGLVPNGGLAITADATALGTGSGLLMSSNGGEFVRIDLADNII